MREGEKGLGEDCVGSYDGEVNWEMVKHTNSKRIGNAGNLRKAARCVGVHPRLLKPVEAERCGSGYGEDMSHTNAWQSKWI